AERTSEAQVAPVAFRDHWHAAYGVYVCDEFRPALSEFDNQEGIHTHGDGVIHIHPFSQNGAGSNANLGVFLDDTTVSLSDDRLEIGNEVFEEGEDTCGDEPGRVVVAKWERVSSDDEPDIRDTDLRDVRFLADG